MAKLVQYLISTILIVPYVLSHIAPRREDLWVFGADKGDSFTGNPKYEFLYVSNNVERITAVWITDDPDVEEELRARGYSVRRRSTVGAKVVTLRAGVAFLSHELRDVVWWCTGGATIVQLWHGVSFKEKGWITREKQGTSILPVKLFKQYVILNYDYFITTSDNLEALHREAFWVPPERILPLGYPRHDVLFDEIPGEDLGFQDGYDRWTTGGDDTQVLYLPTWRDTGADPLTDNDMDLDRLDELLSEWDARLLIKLHPYTDRGDASASGYDNIEIATDNFDIYPVLRNTDLLITDYSSVFSDFLILDRPLVFYAYDYDEFRRRNRELYFDYSEFTPGPICRDSEELYEQLQLALVESEDASRHDRREIREYFFDNVDARSSERVADYFLPRVRS